MSKLTTRPETRLSLELFSTGHKNKNAEPNNTNNTKTLTFQFDIEFIYPREILFDRPHLSDP